MEQLIKNISGSSILLNFEGTMVDLNAGEIRTIDVPADSIALVEYLDKGYITLFNGISAKVLLKDTGYYLAGKPIDIDSRTDQTVVIYDETSEKYYHGQLLVKPSAEILALLAQKANLHHSHAIGDITGLSDVIGGAPSRYTYTTPNLAIPSGTILDIEIPLPSTRVYGIQVSVEGIPSNQALSLMMFGDSNRTLSEYRSEFTDSLKTDTAQAWMYRNLDNENKMHVRLTNIMARTYSDIFVTIVVEPF